HADVAHCLPVQSPSAPTRRSSDLLVSVPIPLSVLVSPPVLLTGGSHKNGESWARSFVSRGKFREKTRFSLQAGGGWSIINRCGLDRKSTRLTSSHVSFSYPVSSL